MKTVAVLGGGPAGAFAAEQLARGGLKTIVFDEKLAWEKPCGGGLTFKAYRQYPFLLENSTPKKLVHTTQIASPGAGRAGLKLPFPVVIYSRYELNKLLLRRAEEAGVAIEKERVLRVTRTSQGWSLRTKHGVLDADFCLVATGARNSFREMGTQWSSADTMLALGYFIPGHRDHIDIQFFPQFEGYIWIFPRVGHLSAGICGKGEPAHLLRKRLERYLSEQGLSLKGATFYGHVLPSLENVAWRENRVGGDGWMAVGDAAGLVDPVTGEGLYYAIRSADMAASVLLQNPSSYLGDYRAQLRHEFTDDLEIASRLAKRLFLGKLAYRDVPARMIHFMRRSPTFCTILQDLFAGTQNYFDLKHRLLRSLNGTLREVVMSFYFSRLVPAGPRS